MLSHLNEKYLSELGSEGTKYHSSPGVGNWKAWTIQTLSLPRELQPYRSVWVRNRNTMGKYNFTLIRIFHNPLPDANCSNPKCSLLPQGDRQYFPLSPKDFPAAS